MKKLFLVLPLLYFSCFNHLFSATVIHAGLLINGESSFPSPEMSIVIEGSKIQAIETGYITPDSEDDFIDLSGYTVLPGLMYMHVHLRSEYSKNCLL